MAPSTPDWETVLQRTQVLLASGRTVAFAAARCRVSRSELEQRLEQAGLPTKGNAAAARLLNTGEVQTLWFPERLGRGDQQPPLAAIIETIESARNSVDIEFRNLTCDEVGVWLECIIEGCVTSGLNWSVELWMLRRSRTRSCACTHVRRSRCA